MEDDRVRESRRHPWGFCDGSRGVLSRFCREFLNPIGRSNSLSGSRGMFTPSHKIINKEPGSDDSDRLNSFEEGVEGGTVTLESVLQSMGRSSERLPTAMVPFQPMGTPAESTVAPVSGVTALTCGIVPPVVRHSFNGHDS